VPGGPLQREGCSAEDVLIDHRLKALPLCVILLPHHTRQPAEVIFLDDHEPNIEAARQVGMHGVVFKNNAQAVVDIQACIQANALPQGVSS
jgi:beta-phosphoglucomutase-like phosphatase (HAD superfamily)